MQLRQIAAAATLLPAVSATGLLEKPTRGWCGTAATPEFLDSVARVQEAEEAEAKAAAKRDPSLPLRPRQAIMIPTYMHAVVNSSVGAEVLGEAALQDQLDVMNERFSPHGVEFRLGAAVTRLVDDELAGGPYGDGVPRRKLYDYWQTTRQGGYDTLNLFFYTNFPWDVFGACTLPEADLPEDSWWEDGCHIASGTLPDGEITGYNLGLTAVHEIVSFTHPNSPISLKVCLTLTDYLPLPRVTGWACSTRSRATRAADRGTSSTTRRRRARRPRAARPARTRVRTTPAPIPSTTTWTIAPTYASPSSPPARRRACATAGPNSGRVGPRESEMSWLGRG